jgi:6-phosphogluconolactonase (cycloisomerase 2 family)
VSDRKTRRNFLSHVTSLVGATFAAKLAPTSASAQPRRDGAALVYAYVGSFTTAERDASGDGINVYRIDSASGRWDHVQNVGDLVNPSFLATDHARRVLYSVHGDEGYATAFAIDAANGRLTLLNRADTGGTNGVHLAVDSSNRFLIVSNYASGSMALLPINADGSLERFSDLVELPGEPGPHPIQQTSSHPHHNPFDRAGRFFIVMDKGLDKVFVLGVDVANGRLTWADTPSIATAPGAGPRHGAFHPTLPIAYVLNELDSTLVTYAYDASNGGLAQRQRISTLPADFVGQNTTAEIEVDRNGRFLYCSNRGHDSIATFSIDATSGELTPVGWTSSGGERPRFFGLDPSGSTLYACNERTHNIVAFRVDPVSGALMRTRQVAETGSPVTIVFRSADA